ncbi:MAG: dephospho-CoA kinase [Defluviitaleaceae bacterium]|nr:dephospho-CoA kinase [Defluviitaleaceae bacterium]
MKIIGITGISGSGKTTITRMLTKMGGYTIEADLLAHDVMRKGQPAYNEIVAAFGTDILDNSGEIQRPALGKLVFGNQPNLARLESIIHPRVISLANTLIANARESGNYKFAVIDAPLLIEAGMHKSCHSCWLITANHDTKLARIMARDNISRETAEKRLASRTGDESLRLYTDTIIENNNIDLESLETKVSLALEAVIDINPNPKMV